MLPAEKSERTFWRVGITVLILLALYIIIWVIHNAATSLKRIHKAYEAPPDESRAPIVLTTQASAVTPPRLFASSTPRLLDSSTPRPLA